MKRLFAGGLFFIILLITLQQPGKTDTIDPPWREDKSYFVFSPDGQYLVKVFHDANSTWVRIHETGEMKTMTQWQIPDFKAHTVRFSLKDPSKLLIADKQRLLVYRLIDDKQTLLFLQPKIAGQEIVQAYFNTENDEIVWATKSVVYKTDTDKNRQQEVLKVPWEEGNIKSVTSLGNEELAVNLDKSNKILLLTPENGFKPVELNGHKDSIVGIQSPQEKQLISLDENYQAVIWNTATREPLVKVKLNKPAEDARLLGVNLDESKKNLQVLTQTKNNYIGQRYLISDLEQGKVNPEILPMTMTSAGNVYSSANSFIELDQEATAVAEESYSARPAPAPQKKKNTLYDLAKIEAENSNYQAALELIKKIPLDDPEYGESRELKRKVFDAIEVQNSVTAAREQINRGNFKSARIILENALIKNPDSELVARHLGKVEEKLDGNSWLKILLIAALLLLLLLLGFVIWRYYSLSLNKTVAKSRSAGKLFGFGGMKRPKQDDNQELRRQFVYKLDETRKLLNKAAINDSERRYKNTWMEITARLNTFEKRARLNDTYLAEFLSELDKVQISIEKLSTLNEKKNGFKFEEESSSQSNQQQAGNSKQQESAKTEQKKTKDQPPDYHAILGVKKNATLEEVKHAYRKKMKDYHPDRHNSSDFKWVKEEADRRTKIVQEAYLKLSELLKS